MEPAVYVHPCSPLSSMPHLIDLDTILLVSDRFTSEFGPVEGLELGHGVVIGLQHQHRQHREEGEPVVRRMARAGIEGVNLTGL